MRDFALLLTAGSVNCPVSIGEQTLELRLLSAYHSLLCRTDAQRLFDERLKEAKDQDALRALCENAALACYALYKGGERVFAHAGEVLDTLSAESLCYITERYGGMRRHFLDVDSLDEAEVMRLKKV